MEKSSFFNSVGGDRKYKAEEWAEYFNSFIGNGVFPIPSSGLQVVQGVGMSVTVKTGKAWLNGYFYFNTSDLSLTLATADGVLNRIDRVVIRWNLTQRTIEISVKSSGYSASPVAPALQRDADAYELCIADIWVGKGITAVLQANITDQRLNSSLCGIVVGTVEEIDTSTFSAQLQSWFATYQSMSEEEFNALVAYMQAYEIRSDAEFAALQAWFAAFKVKSENDFNVWFAVLQNVLDENAATHLLSLITNLTARVTLIEGVLFNDISQNPFLIQFDDLEGIAATGVWDSALQRIEC